MAADVGREVSGDRRAGVSARVLRVATAHALRVPAATALARTARHTRSIHTPIKNLKCVYKNTSLQKYITKKSPTSRTGSNWNVTTREAPVFKLKIRNVSRNGTPGRCKTSILICKS